MPSAVTPDRFVAGRIRWLSIAIGTAGSIGAVLFGSIIGSIPRPHGYHWWLRLGHEGYASAHVWFYLSCALLGLGWLGLGSLAKRGLVSVRHCWSVLVLWALPLFVGVPLFGRDVYSYVAQGQLAQRGLNPYVVAPSALGHGVVLSSIAVVWHSTTSPYGPLFVLLTHLCVAIAGPSLMVQILVFRALEFVGVAALMLFLPMIARRVGVDPGRALWLAVLSPLALFSAVSSSHNDTIMLALVAAATLCALRGARRTALVIFAVASTIKLPAAAGVVIMSAAQWRSFESRQRWQLLGEALAIPTAVVVAVTEIAGYGWTWLGPTALKIPTELHVLTTPIVSVGVFAAAILHGVGIHAAQRSVVTWTQHVGELAAVIAVAWLVLHTRRENVVRYLGLTLLVVVLASPTVWPWYFLWGLTLLAVTSSQRSSMLALVGAGAMLLVGPGGSPMIGGNGFYVTGPLLLAGVVWFFWHGHWRHAIQGFDHAD